MGYEEDFMAIQKAMYESTPFARPPVTDLSVYSALLEKSIANRITGPRREEWIYVARQWLAALGARKSRFALNDLFTELPLLDRFEEVYEAVLSIRGNEGLSVRLTLGTLPAFNPNAFSILLDESNAIVAVSNGIPDLVNRMAKMVFLVEAECARQITEEQGNRKEVLDALDFPAEYNRHARATIRASEDLRHRFISAIIAFYVGNEFILEPHILDLTDNGEAYAREVSTSIMAGAENFILGHEFAHLVLGHLDSDLTEKAEQHSMSPMEWSHQQELSADFYGIVIATVLAAKRQSNRDDPWLLHIETAGPPFFLRLAHYLEQVASEVAGVLSVSTTHPPASLRLDRWAPIYTKCTSLKLHPCEALYGAIQEAFWQECRTEIVTRLGNELSPA